MISIKNMFDICLINKNLLTGFDIDSIEEIMDKNTKIIKTDRDSFFNTVDEYLNLNKDVVADTQICFETKRYIYQLIHVPPTIEKLPQNEDLNSLGSMMLTEPVYGNCVVIKLKVESDQTCSWDSISADNIRDIIRSTMNHKAVKIYADGRVEDKMFYLDPHELLTSTMAPVEFSLFGYNLLMYVDINYDGLSLNRLASRLAGNFFALGDVIVVNRFRYSYGDITKDEIEALDELSWIEYKNREIKNTDKKDAEQDNKKTKIHNRFTVVKNVQKEKDSRIEHKDWDRFFKSIGQNMPINDFALKKSMRGEPSA